MSYKFHHYDMPPFRSEFDERFRGNPRYSLWILEWRLEWVHYVLSKFAVFKLLGILFALITALILVKDILIDQPKERTL